MWHLASELEELVYILYKGLNLSASSPPRRPIHSGSTTLPSLVFLLTSILSHGRSSKHVLWRRPE